MFGPAATLALFAASAPFDINGTVTLETRAGEAPIAPGLAPEASLVGILIPAVDLQYRASNGEVHAGYSVRIFFHETETDPNTTPLFLHTWTLAGNSHPTPRLDLRGNATVVEGAADYAYLPFILATPGTTMGTAPNASSQPTVVEVPRIFSATLEGGALERVSRTTRLELALSGAYHRPIGDSTVAGAVPGQTTAVTYAAPRFTSLIASPGITLRLSPLDDLTLSCPIEYQFVSPLNSVTEGADLTSTHSLTNYTLVPSIAWKARIGRRSQFELRAGVALTHLVSTVPVDNYQATPVGGASIGGPLLGDHEATLLGSVTVATDFYVDPILGTAAPRGTVLTGLTLALPPDWSVGLNGNLTTAFKAHPSANANGPPTYPDEVAVAASLPVRHRVSDGWVTEFGARWADRAPFFTAPNPSFHQRQLWIYLLVTGTTRRAPRAAE